MKYIKFIIIIILIYLIYTLLNKNKNMEKLDIIYDDENII
jgi:hypothetical protein